VSRWNLLDHPFYVAWNSGTLPLETLSTYAAEYGEFIGAVPAAWRALGEEGIARVEDGHGKLWGAFARSLGHPVRTPEVPAVAALCRDFRAMAASPATALGALYAFEAQQPKVAQSKLDGLERHYRAQCPEVSVSYFAAHVDDYEEPAMLEAKLAGMSPAEQAEAREACDRMGQALWGALDGILATSGMVC
jgi:pyrroloquinoline-quinone synthase